MDEAALHRMIGKFPQLLGLSFENNVRPTVAFLVSLGVSPARVLTRHPQALGLSVDGNMRPKIAFLEALGVDVPRALHRHPARATHMPPLSMPPRLSMPPTCHPALACLAPTLCTLVYHPILGQALLSVGLHSKLEPTATFLREEAGMRQLGRALTQQPALASLSVETNLRPKLEWLRELQIPRLADQLDP